MTDFDDTTKYASYRNLVTLSVLMIVYNVTHATIGDATGDGALKILGSVVFIPCENLWLLKTFVLIMFGWFSFKYWQHTDVRADWKSFALALQGSQYFVDFVVRVNPEKRDYDYVNINPRPSVEFPTVPMSDEWEFAIAASFREENRKIPANTVTIKETYSKFALAFNWFFRNPILLQYAFPFIISISALLITVLYFDGFSKCPVEILKEHEPAIQPPISAKSAEDDFLLSYKTNREWKWETEFLGIQISTTETPILLRQVNLDEKYTVFAFKDENRILHAIVRFHDTGCEVNTKIVISQENLDGTPRELRCIGGGDLAIIQNFNTTMTENVWSENFDGFRFRADFGGWNFTKLDQEITLSKAVPIEVEEEAAPSANQEKIKPIGEPSTSDGTKTDAGKSTNPDTIRL